jgi:hypothetical protein
MTVFSGSMLEESLSYPTKGDSGIARILIGGVLLFFGWLLLPLFIIAGYLVRSLGQVSVDPEADPLPFEDWGGLLIEGLKATVISLVYALIPLVFIGVMLVIVGVGGSADSGIVAGVGLLGLLTTLPGILVIQYLVPAALTNFAREGSIAAAFDFEALKPVLVSKSYILATILIFGVSIVGGMVLSFLSIFLIGIVLAPFYYFWLALASQYMYGRAFADASNQQVTPDDTVPATAD